MGLNYHEGEDARLREARKTSGTEGEHPGAHRDNTLSPFVVCVFYFILTFVTVIPTTANSTSDLCADIKR